MVKARIIIVDERGKTLEGEVELMPTVHARASAKVAKPPQRDKGVRPDFDLPERAFIKRYARGLSGPKKFAVLLAYLVKGKVGESVLLKDVEAHWDKMTGPVLLDGKFNRFYSNVARENAWVETKKTGVYTLRSSWRDALSS